MTALHYYIADPTKNITALVETPVPAASRPFVASRVMEREPACEQVGFVYRGGAGEPCLAMAGGEFCGNASLSAAALFGERAGLRPGETRDMRLTVSGAEEPVPVTIRKLADGSFDGAVTLPAPARITEEPLPLNGELLCLPVVWCPGIAHIMVTKDGLTAAEAEAVIRDWCRLLRAPGLGIMLFDSAAMALRPLVYIPGADTLFWESSCASGTGALGAYMALRSGERTALSVREPGGVLRVTAAPGGPPVLSGAVALTEARTLLVDISQ